MTNTGLNPRAHRAALVALALSTMLTPVVGVSPAAAEEKGLEEVIVTAQRRAERLENVPMSVTAVSGDAVEKSGALTLHNLQSLAPGVLISFSGANTQPSIRGVSTNIAGGGVENNVGVYIDGFYEGDPNAINVDLANVANIQVLKGPQGTLYGRNATGGAILITTLAPSKTWTGKVEAGYASFNEKTFSGYLSGPINDRLRFSLVGYSRTTDNYLKKSDPVTGAKTDTPAAPGKTQSVRFKLEGDVTDNLTATVGYNYSLVNDPRTLMFTPFIYISPVIPAGALPATRDPDVKAYNGKTIYLDYVQEGTLTLALQTGIGTLKAYGSYAHKFIKSNFDTDGSYANLTQSINKGCLDTYQATLDYAITAIKNTDLVVGGTYYNDYREFNPNGTYTNGALSNRAENRIRREAYAAYFDATYNVTDRLALSGGGRYSHETAKVDFFSQTPAQIGTTIYTVAPNPRSASFKKFTPRASIRYEVAPQTNVYASYSQGFKSGGWQTGGPALAPIKQETINAYEVGFKMARSQVRFDAAAFYYDYKDLQLSVNVRDPLCPPAATVCTLRPLVVNGPKSRIYGADGQVTVMPVEHLNIKLGLAYLHARYLNFTNAVGNGFNATTGLNISNQVQDWSNKAMPRSPSFSGNLGIDYAVMTSFGDVMLSANTTWTSAYVVGNPSLYGPLAGVIAGKQRYAQEGYAIVNTSITWTDPADRYTLSFFVRNLTDKRYWVNYTGFAFGDYGTLAAPRVVGGRVGIRF